MKLILQVVLAASLCFLATSSAQAQVRAVAKLDTVTVQVTNTGAVTRSRARLERALRKVKGVSYAKVTSKAVTIALRIKDPKVRARIDAIIMAHGFKILRPEQTKAPRDDLPAPEEEGDEEEAMDDDEELDELPEDFE